MDHPVLHFALPSNYWRCSAGRRCVRGWRPPVVRTDRTGMRSAARWQRRTSQCRWWSSGIRRPPYRPSAPRVPPPRRAGWSPRRAQVWLVTTLEGAETRHVTLQCLLRIMVYSHWAEPGKGQRPGTNGLYNIVWKFSHYTLTWDRTGTYCLPLFCSWSRPVSQYRSHSWWINHKGCFTSEPTSAFNVMSMMM